MTASTLDVEGSQVHSWGEISLEELSGENAVHELIHTSCIDLDPSSSDRVGTQADTELVGIEESICKVQRSDAERSIAGIKAEKLWSDKTVSIAVGGGGKAVRYARVDVWVVSKVGTYEKVIIYWAHDFGEVVEISDLLDQSTDDPSAFLEQSLVIPVGVDGTELPGTTVVFSHPISVHDSEGELLIATNITAEKAVHSVGTSYQFLFIDGKRGKVSGKVWSSAKKSSTEFTNSITDDIV